MIAYKQKTEVVHYTIAASFNFSSSGILEIKCPHCGASQELTRKKKLSLANTAERAARSLRKFSVSTLKGITPNHVFGFINVA